MKKKVLAGLIIFVFFLVGFTSGCGGQKKASHEKGGKIVGEVGGEEISWGEFKKQLDSLPPYYRRFLRRPEAMATYLKRYLIKKAMVKEAEARGYGRDPSIRRQVERFKENLLIRKLREELRKKKFSISDDEIKKYYEDHKDSYNVGEERQVKHIMIRVNPGATKKDWKKAKRKIGKALVELRRGKPWIEVFKKYNQDESVNFSKGELPPFTRQKRLRYYMDKNFIDAAFSLKKPGEMKIVKTNFGYHLIQLEKVIPSHTKEFIEVAPEIKRQLEQRKRILAEKQLEDMLVKKYHIKVYKNALEGSSPQKSAPSPLRPATPPRPPMKVQQPQKQQQKAPQQATPGKQQQQKKPSGTKSAPQK